MKEQNNQRVRVFQTLLLACLMMLASVNARKTYMVKEMMDENTL